MKTESTYQKNKRLLQEARGELRELCVHPESRKSIEIRSRERIKEGVEVNLMFGTPYNDKGFIGLIDMIR